MSKFSDSRVKDPKDTSPRPRVALVTCEEFAHLYVDDLLLVSALEEIGVSAVPAVWRRADVDWSGFDALVMRTPWDYFQRAAEFRAWLDARIASGVLMCNAREILDWNFDKSYLRDLAQKGVELVPTICVARQEKADIVALARARGWDEIVVKPTIGGGAYRTYRFRIEDYARHADDIAQTLQDRGVLIQPFLPEILPASSRSCSSTASSATPCASARRRATTGSSFSSAGPTTTSGSTRPWSRRLAFASRTPRACPFTLAWMAS